MLEDVCETIAWTKFGVPGGKSPPLNLPTLSETFELLIIEK